jgi:hypothetical protein
MRLQIVIGKALTVKSHALLLSSVGFWFGWVGWNLEGRGVFLMSQDDCSKCTNIGKELAVGAWLDEVEPSRTADGPPPAVRGGIAQR